MKGFKVLKKIGAALTAVALLGSMSTAVFADEIYSNVDAESAIQITAAEAKIASNVYTVTLDYSISGEVKETDQITMLAYVFEGEAATPSAAVFAEGNIRAIDQTKAGATGKVSFKMPIGSEGYTVAEGAKLVVKLGSNAASVTKAQAFFIDLSKAVEGGPDVVYGDVDGDTEVGTFDDLAIVLNHYLELEYLEDGSDAFAAADVAPEYGVVDFDDLAEFLNYYLELTTSFPVEAQ